MGEGTIFSIMKKNIHMYIVESLCCISTNEHSTVSHLYFNNIKRETQILPSMKLIVYTYLLTCLVIFLRLIPRSIIVESKVMYILSFGNFPNRPPKGLY